jgi:hypothetical protein
MHDEHRVETHVRRPADAFAENPAGKVAKARAALRASAVYADKKGLWHQRVPNRDGLDAAAEARRKPTAKSYQLQPRAANATRADTGCVGHGAALA